MSPATPKMALPRPGVRSVLLGLAGFLLGAVAWLVLTGDRLPVLDAAGLEAARGRWRASHIQDYRMTLVMEGRELGKGSFEVVVRGGKAQSMTRDGAATGGDASAYTVDGLLDTLERELAMAADPQAALGAPAGYRAWLQAELDPGTGLPRRFRRVVGGGGGKWVEWRVTRFERG